MQIKNQFLLACIAVVIFSYTQAATDQDPIIVTATRTAQTMDETLASVTVITREDIERKQAQSLMAILSGVSGIQMTRNGGHGKATSMFLRGSNSNHVLVLVDGVKVGSATFGTAPWQHLPPSQIERIEIVRGPRSSLYGSDAIGGVIHIFTRKPEKDAHSSTGSAGIGTEGTREFNAGISGNHDIYSYSFNIEHFETKGIDARKNNVGPFPVDEPDKDGYDNTSISARLGIQISNKTDIAFTALRADGTNVYDGSFQNEEDFTIETLGTTLNLKPSKDWESTFVVGRSLDQSKNFLADGSGTPSQFDTTRYSASWQNDLYFGTEGVVTLGIDYQKDKVDSTAGFIETRRDNTGVFVQYQDQYSDYDFLVGMRHDDNQQFGGHTTGNIALGHKFSKDMRWFISYGTAFNAPTFNQLYFPSFGDPNLLPEESKSTEFALQGKLSKGRWRIATFRTEIDNLINNIPENVDKAVIKGLEATLSTTVAEWLMSVDGTLLDAKDVSTGNQLPRRPKTSLKVDLSRKYSKGGIGLSLLAEGGRYDDAANTTKVNSYGVVNIYSTYGLNKHWILKGKIDNLFDKNYETIDTYNALGRTVFVSLSYRYH